VLNFIVLGQVVSVYVRLSPNFSSAGISLWVGVCLTSYI